MADVGAFDRLHPAVQFHVVNSLGFRSLRPLQKQAIEPVLAGTNALLLAPTAGGKTEAAMFPVLSRMLAEDWQRLSVLYVCPIKALLNNLQVRLERYGGLVGRRVATWHGDVGDRARARLLADPPDILLTTPESIEAMMISSRVDAATFLGDARCVVVDEIHAFAGDDRGWHLVAVLDRVERLCGHRLQRIGLSATVGNPDELLAWLVSGGSGAVGGTGAIASAGSGVVVNPPTAGLAEPEVTLDWVGGLANAAKVIASLHRGEKRLVFCDSRSRSEELASQLRQHGVETFVSHSSLSLDERRRAEAAFAQARDCVIVATSTLELGIDVGDLDRVIQIDAPGTVASFLQRLGRTGRRPGRVRNCLFLATSDDAFLVAAALLKLWRDGFVEPIVPPPLPAHIYGQQVLALVLQRGVVGRALIEEELATSPVALAVGRDRCRQVLDHMFEIGMLHDDGGLASIGRTAESTFGHRYFTDLMSVFDSPPLFKVLHGRRELGSVHERSFQVRRNGPAILSLAGHGWRVTHLDWARRIAYVEPSDERGRSSWLGGESPLRFELCQAVQAVASGTVPDVRLTARATDKLAELHADFAWVPDVGTIVRRDDSVAHWWTFAGLLANLALAHAMKGLTDDGGRSTNSRITLGTGVTAQDIAAFCTSVREAIECGEPVPTAPVDANTLTSLKFHECLPLAMAVEVLSSRLADELGTAASFAAPWCPAS